MHPHDTPLGRGVGTVAGRQVSVPPVGVRCLSLRITPIARSLGRPEGPVGRLRLELGLERWEEGVKHFLAWWSREYTIPAELAEAGRGRDWTGDPTLASDLLAAAWACLAEEAQAHTRVSPRKADLYALLEDVGPVAQFGAG